MKLLILFIVIMASVGSGNCNDDKISGKYRTVIFIQPSASDYPVNLHEEGGYVELNLKPDFIIEAKWFVPALPEHHIPKNEMIYKGKYSVTEDTIKISGTNSFWDNEIFIYKDGKLEVIKRLRRGPMDLVFEKVKD